MKWARTHDADAQRIVGAANARARDVLSVGAIYAYADSALVKHRGGVRGGRVRGDDGGHAAVAGRLTLLLLSLASSLLEVVEGAMPLLFPAHLPQSTRAAAGVWLRRQCDGECEEVLLVPPFVYFGAAAALRPPRCISAIVAPPATGGAVAALAIRW